MSVFSLRHPTSCHPLKCALGDWTEHGLALLAFLFMSPLLVSIEVSSNLRDSGQSFAKDAALNEMYCCALTDRRGLSVERRYCGDRGGHLGLHHNRCWYTRFIGRHLVVLTGTRNREIWNSRCDQAGHLSFLQTKIVDDFETRCHLMFEPQKAQSLLLFCSRFWQPHDSPRTALPSACLWSHHQLHPICSSTTCKKAVHFSCREFPQRYAQLCSFIFSAIYKSAFINKTEIFG